MGGAREPLAARIVHEPAQVNAGLEVLRRGTELANYKGMRCEWLTVLLLACALPTMAQAPTRTTGPRLRMGGDLGIGGSGGSDRSPTERIGAALDAIGHFRAGAQMDDLWAIEYSATFAAGAPVDPYGGGRCCDEHFLHVSSLLFEVTIENVFQIGLGPSLAIGSIDQQLSIGPGGSGRIAFVLGGNGTGTRQGLSIGAQVDIYYDVRGYVVGIVGPSIGWDTF